MNETKRATMEKRQNQKIRLMKENGEEIKI